MAGLSNSQSRSRCLLRSGSPVSSLHTVRPPTCGSTNMHRPKSAAPPCASHAASHATSHAACPRDEQLELLHLTERRPFAQRRTPRRALAVDGARAQQRRQLIGRQGGKPLAVAVEDEPRDDLLACCHCGRARLKAFEESSGTSSSCFHSPSHRLQTGVSSGSCDDAHIPISCLHSSGPCRSPSGPR